MAGRYGTDQLNNFMTVVYLILYVVSIFTRWSVLYWVALVLVFVTLFRCFSRQVERRRAENAKFLQWFRPIQRKLKNFRARMKDKDHRYFKCPNCKQQMRVPRGKGRITVHCRSCGATFEEKS
jgi:ribosomal protein S27E